MNTGQDHETDPADRDAPFVRTGEGTWTSDENPSAESSMRVESASNFQKLN